MTQSSHDEGSGAPRSSLGQPLLPNDWLAIEAEQLIRALASGSRPSEALDKLLRLAQLAEQAYQGVDFTDRWKAKVAANPMTPVMATFFAAALGRFAEAHASANPKKSSTTVPRLFIESFGVAFGRARPWSEVDEGMAEEAFWEGLTKHVGTSQRPNGATKADVDAGMESAFKELYTEAFLRDGGYVSSDHSKQMREVKQLIRRRLPWVDELLKTES